MIDGREGSRKSKVLGINTHAFASIIKKFQDMTYKNEEDFLSRRLSLFPKKGGTVPPRWERRAISLVYTCRYLLFSENVSVKRSC